MIICAAILGISSLSNFLCQMRLGAAVCALQQVSLLLRCAVRKEKEPLHAPSDAPEIKLYEKLPSNQKNLQVLAEK